MELTLHVADYIIMVAFLVISLGIGVYYGLIRKQRTTEEYLLGNRKMQLLPVAMSMLVTYQSAISVIGVPAEFYLYHAMLCYVYIGISASVFIQYVMIVPLMYPLHLTSAYELVYMSMVLLAPSLAIEAVAGIPLWISVVIVGIIGTVYTSLGGIKSVIWTDVFQFVILFGGLIVLLILGVLKLGSYQNVWNLCTEGDRIVFDIVDADPRVRHSIWSCIIGGAFNWLPNLCNQSAVQRICSMRTEKQSKWAVLLNIPLTLLYGAILFLFGTVMYAYYANEHCDPLEAGYVANGNQVAPYFVMTILANLPGLAGLFLAALFSGALSSLSSGINSMGANTVQDILAVCLRNATQMKKTLIAKVLVFLYGAVAVTMAYFAKDLTGPVSQISLSASGAFGGPVAGLIFLGGLFPQANWIGATIGGVLGLGVNVWVSVGSVLFGKKTPFSPPIGIDGCGQNQTQLFGSTSSTERAFETITSTMKHSVTGTTMRESDPAHLAIYDVSYLYFGLIGFIVTVVAGIIISIATDRSTEYLPDSIYIFPGIRSLWKYLYKRQKNISGYDKQPKASSKSEHDHLPLNSCKVDLTSYSDLVEVDGCKKY